MSDQDATEEMVIPDKLKGAQGLEPWSNRPQRSWPVFAGIGLIIVAAVGGLWIWAEHFAG